jgi:pyruvate, orthophosphate dikinase
MLTARIGNSATTQYGAETVGAKAANLARMAALGLPVPPAFVLPIDLCGAVLKGGKDARKKVTESLTEGIGFLEQTTDRRFGDRRAPLLVSVRSGAARSMPGMLGTVLDVGCTTAAVHGLMRMTGNPRFAWDCRRRFLESYGSVVLGLEPAQFAKRHAALGADDGLDSDALERLAGQLEEFIEQAGEPMPDDPMEQLASTTEAVYRSWMSERACTYRKLQHLEDLQGTGVAVQVMVFGNKDHASGSGVAFSRDPSTGAAKPMIDFLLESQGEDIVSGNRTPQTEDAIARCAPHAADKLQETLTQLEREFTDVQDVEFTIESGRLWVLQTRSAKRTPLATLRFAVDFVNEGLITPQEALRRLNGLNLNGLARQRLPSTDKPIASGTGASAGVAVGRAAFSLEHAENLASRGDPVILMRPEISTADVAGFAISSGIVTSVGGRTAHAALVARQMAKPCVVGCAALTFEPNGHGNARLAGHAIKPDDWVSIDGETGGIFLGRHEVITERPDEELAKIERWRAKERDVC